MNEAATKATPTDENAPMLLRAVNLSVKFGPNLVLRNIKLDIRKGETLAVIGESGCGKTVLLKTLVGLVRPTQGDILFDGKSIPKMTEQELTAQRLRFGFVFQQAALFDSMSIYENVAFALREHKTMSEAEIKENVRERLLEVGLAPEIVHRKPVELSGGMRKRVGLARAVALNPEVMLYDEPTTGLDPIMSDVINELILQMRKRRPVTSVVVTHDMKSALKVASRVVMLYPIRRLKPDEKQMIYDGPPGEIEASQDSRVIQFIQGEARERLMEMERYSEEHKDDE